MKHAPSSSVLSLVLAAGLLGQFACAAPRAQEPAAPPRTAAEVVAATRHALGWDALAKSKSAVRVTGPARILGTDATQVTLFDGAGRFLETVDGPMAQSNGDDGKTSWVRDWSDSARVLVLGDLADAQIAQAFATGGWTADSAPLRFDPEVVAAGDEIVLSFAHENGIVRGTVNLDARTFLPRSASYASDSMPTTWTFGPYETRAGIALPKYFEYGSGGHRQRFEPARVERVEHPDPAVFAPRLGPPADARFDRAIAPALEVKRAKTGHLLVHPLIDGKDLGWFIFDTGAGTNCISNSVTKELGTEPFGEIGAMGVGGSVTAHFWRAGRMTLGPITVDAPRFMGLDLAFLEPHFGVPVGGILGYELLARCVAEIDMTAGEIALHDPKTYALPAAGKWEDVLLYGRHPCVRATYEGHEGVFRIDTGAAQDTVTFHYQAVHDLGLVDGRETTESRAGGVGGDVKTKVGKLASFRLGGHDFAGIEANFALEDKGALSDDYVSGNIGGRLLAPFRMSFDYPGGRIGFVPRP